MNKIILGVLMAALFAAPSLSRAETGRDPAIAKSTASGVRQAEATTATDPTSEADNYSKREAAAATAGEFQGGGTAVYIGGGVLAVALLVVIIVLIL